MKKTRKPKSPTRIAYEKQYRRVSQLVRNINRRTGLQVSNPLPKPSQLTRATRARVESAMRINTKTLMHLAGYLSDGSKIQDGRRKRQPEVPQNIQTLTTPGSTPPEIDVRADLEDQYDPTLDMTRREQENVIVDNLKVLVSQFPPGVSDKLGNMLDYTIRTIGVPGVAAMIEENPGILDLAQNIVTYNGDQGGNIAAFADLMSWSRTRYWEDFGDNGAGQGGFA